MDNKVEKTVITIVGKDTIGIIAKVSTYLSEHKANVLDISQNIVAGYFNMMIIADMSTMTKPFGECKKDLEKIGEDIGVIIKCQREEIFEKMHRI